jgi:hypothetical protein
MSQSAAFSSEWFAHHRARLDHWRHDNLHQVIADLNELQDEMQQLVAQQSTTPATVTITGSLKGPNT